MAAARASRASVLILATVAAAMSRGWLVLPAGVALALAFAAVFLRRSHQRLGALTGALAIQVVLRWPAIGFHGVTALVAAAAIVPVLWSAWARQRRQWRRALLLGAAALFGLAVVLSLPVVIGNLLARSPANHGIAATRQALTAISAGDSASAALELRTATGALEHRQRSDRRLVDPGRPPGAGDRPAASGHGRRHCCGPDPDCGRGPRSVPISISTTSPIVTARSISTPSGPSLLRWAPFEEPGDRGAAHRSRLPGPPGW